MKRKTKTIRICSKLHSRLKKHLQPKGVKMEAWTEAHIATAIATETVAPDEQVTLARQRMLKSLSAQP